MRRSWLAWSAVLLFAFAPHVPAQTYEELLKENQQLKARLAALESKPVRHGAADHEPAAGDKHADHEAGPACGHGDDPSDRYDFFRPFHSHCDKHRHGYGLEDAHGDGHEEENLGHDRHESIYGYPFFHALRTDHAFIERHFDVQYVRSNFAGNGDVDETELEFELFWAVNNRIAVFVEGPYRFLDPNNDDPSRSGFGDLTAGARFVAWNAPHSLLTFGLAVTTPTGAEGRGLGGGRTILEPSVLGLVDFGKGLVLQTEVVVEIPVGVRADIENELAYNFALGKTLLRTGENRFFKWVTPIVELNGRTVLNGAALSNTVIDLTPSISWQAGAKHHFGLGASFPISDRQDFDTQLRFNYIFHF